jgi:hypothetical protein
MGALGMEKGTMQGFKGLTGIVFGDKNVGFGSCALDEIRTFLLLKL